MTNPFIEDFRKRINAKDNWVLVLKVRRNNQ